MSDDTKNNLKLFVKDYLPAMALAAGVIASYATMNARHEDAMRRIAAIEATVNADHDKVTALAKDVEYIRHAVDEIKFGLRTNRGDN